MNGQRKATKQRASPTENGSAAKRMRLNGKQESKPIKNGKTKLKPNRKNKLKSNGIRNGNGVKAQFANDSDDSGMQIDFDNNIPFMKVHHQNGMTSAHNNTTTSTISECNGSPSLRQKVKFITADHFVHIKPPPINTEKIYVKQYTNGSQRYGLGDIPMIHNKLITVKQKEPTDQVTAMATATVGSSASSYKSDEETSELTSNTTDDVDTNFGNFNIYDIPILFADNDDVKILENPNVNGNNNTPVMNILTQTDQMEPSKTIEIISEEIITDAIIGEFAYLHRVL